MDLTEMIGAEIERGGDGASVVRMLVEYGHLPPDANERPAQLTARQCAWAAKTGGPS